MMKKRLIPLLLVALLVFAGLPGAAFANTDEPVISGTPPNPVDLLSIPPVKDPTADEFRTKLQTYWSIYDGIDQGIKDGGGGEGLRFLFGNMASLVELYDQSFELDEINSLRDQIFEQATEITIALEKARSYREPPVPKKVDLYVVPDAWKYFDLIVGGDPVDVTYGVSPVTLPGVHSLEFVWDVQSSDEKIVSVGNVVGLSDDKYRGTATLKPVGFGEAKITFDAKLVLGTEPGYESAYDVVIYSKTITVFVGEVVIDSFLSGASEQITGVVADVKNAVDTAGKEAAVKKALDAAKNAIETAAGKAAATPEADALKKAVAAKKAVVLKKISGVSAKSIKAKIATISWKSVKASGGYEIKLATDKAFTKNVKTVTAGSKATIKTVKSLKKGKTYYVKVRAYKTIDGEKVYGAYSAPKKIKVK